MAKLDKRKVRIHRLSSNTFNNYSNRYDTYFSLRIGVYKYAVTKNFELVRFDDAAKCRSDLFYEPFTPMFGYRRYWYSFRFTTSTMRLAKEVCEDKQKALLYSRTEGLELICGIKLKYFADKEIDFKLW